MYTSVIMLNTELQQRLNAQIQHEAFASQSYLLMASWCEQRDLPGVAEYFYRSAEDERSHMLEFYRYLNGQGGFARLETLPASRDTFDNVLQLFEHTLQLEVGVSQSINELAGYCQSSHQYAAFQFLQPFIAEQANSEKSVSELIAMIKRVGYEERNLYYLDKSFKKMATANDAKAGA